MEAELPFGSPRKQSSFFEPIYKELEKKVSKVKMKFFRVLRVFKERKKWFLKVRKEKTGWILPILLIRKQIMKEFEKVNPIFLFKLSKVKVYEPHEKKKNDKTPNKITRESSIQIRSMNWTSYSLIEKKVKDLADRTLTTRNQIEQITKDNKKIAIICDGKRLESCKNIFQILKRQYIRLLRKSDYFMKSFIEKIYINIFHIFSINIQLFFE
ncbi:hypothetical protein DsansV1_C01g0007601 [Dioscorea sansibarensis]